MRGLWIGVLLYILGVIFFLSSPRRLRYYLPGALLALMSGLIVEYALGTLRPLWEGAILLIPLLGREAIWVLLFYFSQGLLFFQFMPRVTSLQLPYAITLGFGTALFESILARLGLVTPQGWSGFALAGSLHALRLAALVGVYHALRYEERVEALQEQQAAEQRFHLARRLWMVAWPGAGLVAFLMLRITQRLARS